MKATSKAETGRATVSKFVESAFPLPAPHAAVSPEKQVERPVKYDLASGEMDMDGFDFALWKRYLNKAFTDQSL